MNNKSVLYRKDPNWIINHPGVSHRVPANIQSWIYESGSLTKRVKQQYGETFAVEVLFHQWRLPFLSESRLLQHPHDQFCLIREVLLTGNGIPLILARTIIPQQTLKGAQRTLSRLGNRPLGEVIFSYPKLKRLEMDIALVEKNNWTHYISKKTNVRHAIWGRRTIYKIKDRQMLVSEFFLDDVVNF